MEFASPIPKKHARIEIIPLIDIMFFLLASFMMVSLSQTTMKGMKVALPTGSSGQTQSKKDYVSFSVDRDGYIYWDKVKIDYPDVLTKLRETRATNPLERIWSSKRVTFPCSASLSPRIKIFASGFVARVSRSFVRTSG